MQIQSNLASTIAMAFDECPSSVAEKKYIADSVERTTRWLKRCKDEIARLNSLPDTINPHQMLFGINQGGVYEDIRIAHAQQIAEIIGEYRINRDGRGEKRSLQRSVETFLAAKKIDGLAAKTLKNYREMLGAFAASVDKPAVRITTDDIRGYIGQLAARGLRDSSIQTHINTLRSFFAWLELEDMIRKNPMRKIKSLKIDRMAARRPLEPEEMERLRDSCQTYKERALVEFMASSGCRLSEVIGIRIDQVDWKRRSVKVLGKGHKERVVYFSVRACLMLQEYISRRKGGQTLFASSRTPYAPMSPRAAAPSSASMIAWRSTSASECPSNPFS